MTFKHVIFFPKRRFSILIQDRNRLQGNDIENEDRNHFIHFEKSIFSVSKALPRQRYPLSTLTRSKPELHWQVYPILSLVLTHVPNWHSPPIWSQTPVQEENTISVTLNSKKLKLSNFQGNSRKSLIQILSFLFDRSQHHIFDKRPCR